VKNAGDVTDPGSRLTGFKHDRDTIETENTQHEVIIVAEATTC